MLKKKTLIIISSILAAIAIVSVIFIFNNNNKDNNKKTTYKVTFDSNGGSLVEEQIVNEGGNAIKPNDPTKEGYLFIEWLYNNESFNFAIKIKEDINLIAKWQEVEENIEMVTIKFETNGGTTISNQTIEKGSKITTPVEPTKEGYIFKGWYYNGEHFNFDNPINENIEINAKWERTPEKEEKPVEEKYTVTFNSNGGNSIKNQTVKKDEKVTKPNNPTKEGYIFINWTLNDKEFNFDTKITKNITLVANWSLLGDVNINNKIEISDTAIIKQYIEGTKELTNEQKIAADVNQDSVIDDIDADIISKYLAKEIAKLPYNSEKKYTITYNLNGGNFEEGEYIRKKYSTVSLPYTLHKPVKDDYVFIGWTGSNGDIPQLKITISKGTNGNLEYNANWGLYGDVNSDNKIDISDSLIIQRYIEGTKELTDMQKMIADVNLDSKVNDNDVAIIRDYLAKIIDKLPYTS